MTILAVIPARGGSVRLPRKNMKQLAGKPLIQWTIEAALESECVDEVIVSSDSSEIIKFANSFGELAPFVRPADLATETAKSADVAKHALDHAQASQKHFDYVVFLQPTSPFRSAAHIDAAFETLRRSSVESVVSVCECEKSPMWSASLSGNGTLEFLEPEKFLQKRSQDLPVYYCLNGAIYFISSSLFREIGTLIDASTCTPYIMSRKASVDIDTEIDFHVAEALASSPDQRHESYLQRTDS